MVKEIKSKAEFDELINSGKVIIIDFWATWCGPCRFISPHFEKLEQENAKEGVEYYKVDVDEVPDVSEAVGIRAMPTFIAFKNGERLGDLVGANQQGLTNLIQTSLDKA